MKDGLFINTMEIIGRFLLDLLFPIECLGCKKPLTGHYLCASCFGSIKIKNDWRCAFCSVATPGGATCPLCRRRHQLDNLWVAAEYHQRLVKESIGAFKYKFVSDLKEPLGRVLVKFLKERGRDRFLQTYQKQIVLMPVPLHSRRLNWRSYNQAELLAQELAKNFRLKVDNRNLQRIKGGKPQAKIEGREHRLENVHQSFRCHPRAKFKNKTVLLIDDVATTGSTLDECARVLKEAGAEKVIGLVIAKG